MKNKQKLMKICNTVAFIFALSFLLQLVRDWSVYNSSLNSAPFRLWILADVVKYLMPAAFAFLIGRIAKLQKDKEEN